MLVLSPSLTWPNLRVWRTLEMRQSAWKNNSISLQLIDTSMEQSFRQATASRVDYDTSSTIRPDNSQAPGVD